jgi:hypothetical protein
VRRSWGRGFECLDLARDGVGWRGIEAVMAMRGGV